MVAAAASLALSLAGGCAGGPAAPADALAPDTVAERSIRAITLRGAVVGVEERETGPSEGGTTTEVARRRYRFESHGETVDVEDRTAVRRSADGEIVAAELRDGDGVLRWDGTGDVPGWAVPKDDDLVVEVPVDVAPELVPVDVGQLLSVASPAVPRARTSRTADVYVTGDVPTVDGVQTVGGGVVHVVSPLDAEIPGDVLASLRDLVRRSRDRVRPGARIGPPSPLSATGDCDDLAAAFVGLATADGWSARPVVGLVYVDDPPSFRLHAWVVAERDGRVVPVDPTFDEPIADATRVILGDGADPAAVLHRLDALAVSRVDAR